MSNHLFVIISSHPPILHLRNNYLRVVVVHLRMSHAAVCAPLPRYQTVHQLCYCLSHIYTNPIETIPDLLILTLPIL